MSARSGSVSGVFVTPIAMGRKLPSCATRDVAHDRHSTFMPTKDKSQTTQALSELESQTQP